MQDILTTLNAEISNQNLHKIHSSFFSKLNENPKNELKIIASKISHLISHNMNNLSLACAILDSIILRNKLSLFEANLASWITTLTTKFEKSPNYESKALILSTTIALLIESKRIESVQKSLNSMWVPKTFANMVKYLANHGFPCVFLFNYRMINLPLHLPN